jgi:hypothetical protein
LGGQIDLVCAQFRPFVCLGACPHCGVSGWRCGVAGEAKKARKATDDSAKQGKKRSGPPARPPLA